MIVVSLVFLVTQSEFSHVNVLLSAGSSCYSKISARCLSQKKPPPPLFTADLPRQGHTSEKACKGEGFGESGLFLTLHPPSLGLSLDLKLARAVFLLEPWFLFSNKKKVDSWQESVQNRRYVTEAGKNVWLRLRERNMLSPFIESFPNEVLKFLFCENCLNKKQRNETQFLKQLTIGFISYWWGIVLQRTANFNENPLTTLVVSQVFVIRRCESQRNVGSWPLHVFHSPATAGVWLWNIRSLNWLEFFSSLF